MGFDKINFDLDDTSKAVVALMRAIALDDDDKTRHTVFTTHAVKVKGHNTETIGKDTKEKMFSVAHSCTMLLSDLIPAIEDKTGRASLAKPETISGGVALFFSYLEDSPDTEQAYHRMSVIRDRNEWMIGMYLLRDDTKGNTKENRLMAIYWHIVK